MSASAPVVAANAGGVGERAARPRRAGLWPWVPGVLLGSLLGAQLLVLGSTLDDPTFSTERDYYRKAVDWDAQRARQRESDALGWSSRASIERRARGVARLRVQLTDARARALPGAAVRVTAFHNAHAAQRLELTLREAEPGVYEGELGAARPGLWEVRVSAERAGAAYESTLRVDLTQERAP